MTGRTAISESDIDAACGGDESARERLFAALQPRLRMMIRVRIGPSSGLLNALDDIVQECQLGLLTLLPKLEARTLAGLNACASTIVRNKVADRLRSRARGLPMESPRITALEQAESATVWSLLNSVVDEGTSPSGAAARDEAVRRMLADLDRLAPRQRTALTLAFFDQLNSSQVAEVLNLKRTTAAMLISRSVAALRELQTGRSGGLSSR